MKATGITRRLDELGRIVIPKEIRHLHHIKEGDLIEFFVNEHNQIIIQKYSALKEDCPEIEAMCSLLNQQCKKDIYFTLDDSVHCINGKTSNQISQRECTEEFINTFKVYRETPFEDIRLFKDDEKKESGVVFPINGFGVWLGSFVVINGQNCDESEITTINAYCNLISKKHEI